jgi:hypothetical protein
MMLSARTNFFHTGIFLKSNIPVTVEKEICMRDDKTCAKLFNGSLQNFKKQEKKEGEEYLKKTDNMCAFWSVTVT